MGADPVPAADTTRGARLAASIGTHGLVTTILREAGEPITDEAVEATSNLGLDWDAAQAGDPDALEDALITTLGPNPERLISQAALALGQLGHDCTGVYWPDANWTECRGHLDDTSWPDGTDADLAKIGVQLFGNVVCDDCAWRDAGED